MIEIFEYVCKLNFKIPIRSLLTIIYYIYTMLLPLINKKLIPKDSLWLIVKSSLYLTSITSFCCCCLHCWLTSDMFLMKGILHLFLGNNCEIEVDECLSDPCRSGATCVDHLNAFSCVSQDGFQGIKKSIDIVNLLSVLPEFFYISHEMHVCLF